ncbi:MAG TPA: PrsW family glutamic-type intramembrane protease [Candidatus Saccharimonadia bacterium]
MTNGIGRWTWLRLLLGGVVAFILIERALAFTGSITYVPALLLVGALTVPVAFCAFLYSRDRTPDVPWTTLGWCALWGGVLGSVLAGRLEFDTVQHLGTIPVIAIGVIEEFAKFVVPAWLTVRHGYSKEMDGLMLGAAAGAGFAVLESMGYGLTGLFFSGGNLTFTVQLLFFRGLMAPATHIAWTGLITGAFWSAWHRRSLRRFLYTFAGVVILHSLWDGTGSFTWYLVLTLVSLGWLFERVHAIARRTA